MKNIIEKLSSLTSGNLLEYVVVGIISIVILCLIYAIYSCIKYLKIKDEVVKPATKLPSYDDEKFDIFKAAKCMEEALEGQTIVYTNKLIDDEVNTDVGYTSLKRRRELTNTTNHSVKDIIEAIENENIDIDLFEAEIVPVDIPEENPERFRPAKFVSPVYGFVRPESFKRELNSKEIITKSNNMVKEELREAENLLNNLKELRKNLG